ncbi:GtrA family protein [Neobacillus drentensis]|uniref:GtrA family protein n=1 Tax=Neobacillus drentensis TaxID=220684 RepID=UPI002FFFA7B1
MKNKKEILMYLLFGILTTGVNILCYVFLKKFLNIDFILSTTIAWIISVIFAFLTNKKYVFNSNFTKAYSVIREFCSFTIFRGISFITDIGMMIVLIEVMNINDLTSKILANIVVVIINYIVSKFVVFKVKRVDQ